MEIIARDDRADPETADQDFNDESLRMKARQNLVEGDDDHAVDAELLQRPGLGVAWREAKDRVGTHEKIGRMRFEGKHRAGTVKLLGERRGAFDDRDVTAMNAIKIADRDHRAGKSGRRRGRINGDDEFFRRGRIGQGNPNRKTPSLQTFLPHQLRDRRRGRKIGGFQELPERGGVERRAFGAAVQLHAMDAGCHKETIKALVVRAFDIGSHGVANHEDPRGVDGFGVRSPREFECARENRGKGLAGLDYLAARPGVAFRDRAGTIKQLAAVLHHDIGIGANELEVAGAHRGKEFFVIGGRLVPGIGKAGAEDEVRLFQRLEAGRFSTQRQYLLEKGGFIGRAKVKQAGAGALDEQGNRDVAGRDNRIIGFSRYAKPGELRRHDPTWIGRVRHEHDLAAARPEAAKRLGGSLEGHESIVDDAPDVAQNDVVSAREIGQSAHQASHAIVLLEDCM